MIAVLFGAIAVICAIGWFANYISVLALSMWIVRMGYDAPTEKELKGCSTYVIKKLLHIK